MRKLTEYEQGRQDALVCKYPALSTAEYLKGYEAGIVELKCRLL